MPRGGRRCGAGRKKKDAEGKQLQGEVVLAEIRQAVPSIELDQAYIVKMQTTASYTDVYRRFYDYFKKEEALEAVPLQMFNDLVRLETRFEEVENKINESGFLTITDKGEAVNPLVKVSSTYRDQIAKLWGQIELRIKEFKANNIQTKTDEMEALLS